MIDPSDGPHLPSIGGLRRERPLAAPPPVMSSDPAAPPVIDLANTDVPCRNCGFNLRGLTPETRCPECGQPVAHSIAVDHLIYCAPDYLRKLSIGLTWVLVISIVQLVLSFGALSVSILILVLRSNGVVVSPIWDHASTLAGVPLSLALLYGWWQFSEADPGMPAISPQHTPRKIVRWASVILVGATTMATFSLFYSAGNPRLILIYGGIALLAPIAALFQFFATLVYVSSLARRMHDKSLVDTATRNMWMLPLIYIFGFCVLGLGPLIAMILYLLMLNALRIRINAVRQRQQQLLATETMPA